MTEQQRGGDVVDAYLADTPDQETEDMTTYHWTEDNRLETDPEGMTPIRADVDDADVWPVVKDRKGRVVQRLRPEPGALAAATRRAREMQAFDLSELAATPSHEEGQAVISQEARHRSDLRGLAEKRHKHEIALSEAQINHEANLAERARQAENKAHESAQRQRKALDPTTRLNRLAVAERFLPALALVPAVAAVVVGAVNVGGQMARINPSAALVGWMVEPLFTLPLLLVLAAQVLGAIPKPDLSAGVSAALRTNRYVGLEVVLTLAAVVLNVVPHEIPTGHWSGGLVWLAVPAGLAFSAYLVPKLVADIRQALADFSPAPSRPVEAGSSGRLEEVLPTPSDLRGKNPANEVLPEPGKKSPDEVRAAFANAVKSGEIDPVNDSVNAVAKALGVRWHTAKRLVAEHQSGQ